MSISFMDTSVFQGYNCCSITSSVLKRLHILFTTIALFFFVPDNMQALKEHNTEMCAYVHFFCKKYMLHTGEVSTFPALNSKVGKLHSPSLHICNESDSSVSTCYICIAVFPQLRLLFLSSNKQSQALCMFRECAVKNKVHGVSDLCVWLK